MQRPISDNQEGRHHRLSGIGDEMSYRDLISPFECRYIHIVAHPSVTLADLRRQEKEKERKKKTFKQRARAQSSRTLLARSALGLILPPMWIYLQLCSRSTSNTDLIPVLDRIKNPTQQSGFGVIARCSLASQTPEYPALH